jgi:hypothetical protein
VNPRTESDPVLRLIDTVIALAVQSYLATELTEPVPRCPRHDHALDLTPVETAPGTGSRRQASTPSS